MWIEKKRAMLQFYPRFQAICYSREEDKKCLLTASFYELSCCIKSFRVALNQLQFFDREPKKLHSQSKNLVLTSQLQQQDWICKRIFVKLRSICIKSYYFSLERPELYFGAIQCKLSRAWQLQFYNFAVGPDKNIFMFIAYARLSLLLYFSWMWFWLCTTCTSSLFGITHLQLN